MGDINNYNIGIVGTRQLKSLHDQKGNETYKVPIKYYLYTHLGILNIKYHI